MFLSIIIFKTDNFLFRYSHELAYHEDEFEYEDEEEDVKLEEVEGPENSKETENSPETEPSGASEQTTEFTELAEHKITYSRRSEKTVVISDKDDEAVPRGVEERSSTDNLETDKLDTEENAEKKTGTEKEMGTGSVDVEPSKIACTTEAQSQKENLCENSENVRDCAVASDSGEGS